MDTRYLESSPRLVGPHHHHHSRLKTTFTPSHPPQTIQSDNDRSAVELRALDCNLTALCDHIRSEGFGSGAFSDVVLHVMGSTYHLHRLILSRSSYFRNMLHGPWKEASSSIVTLHVDDKNVNDEAISVALAYLYGHHPKLNDNNAFRVLAAASFLDLQDLCAICTDFIISELWTSNFLEFQVFAESQDYGIHGERVKNACWGYLCQSGAMELKEVLPKLSSQTLHALLTSDELWVPSEEKRFELAICAFRAKGALSKTKSEQPEQGGSRFESGTTNIRSDSLKCKGKQVMDACSREGLECELGHLRLKDNPTNANTNFGPMVELRDCVIDFQRGVSGSQATCKQSNIEPVQSSTVDQSSTLDSSFSNQDEIRTCSYMDLPIIDGNDEVGEMALEGPSDEGMCYHLSEDGWVSGKVSRHCSSLSPSCNTPISNERGRSDVPALSWGGRVVGSREHKGYTRGKCGFSDEEFDAFEDIFEGGSLLYSNMSFDALLTVRKHLEELGFPCKAVNDGLWLQMLLSQRVQETAANTCTKCCLMRIACACAPAFGLSHGATITTYYNPENTHHENTGNIYVTNPNQGEENGIFRPVRVYVRGQHIDGLAGLGCGATYVPPSAWPATRFVYSRVPINRNDQQTLANDDPEGRNDQNGEISGDGLTALVGLSQGGNCSGSGHGEQTETVCNNNMPVEMLESQEHSAGFEWESRGHSSISLDMKTPLSHFPPFRFGVEFEEVHRLCDGQVKHSSEFYYAGSFWKVSVQAFNDEDPQGRRTLGLFLHRRKAEPMVSPTKSHVYVDSREKVTARYQLICPSKREVMVFGSFKQRGTLLPKAPKGWGWRTALLFDELSDLLQNGALRVAAVVQLV